MLTRLKAAMLVPTQPPGLHMSMSGGSGRCGTWAAQGDGGDEWRDIGVRRDVGVHARLVLQHGARVLVAGLSGCLEREALAAAPVRDTQDLQAGLGVRVCGDRGA